MEVMRSFRIMEIKLLLRSLVQLNISIFVRKLSCAVCISVTASGDSYLPPGSEVGSMGAEWELVTRASLGSQIKCQRGAHLGW